MKIEREWEFRMIKTKNMKHKVKERKYKKENNMKKKVIPKGEKVRRMQHTNGFRIIKENSHGELEK